MSQAGGDSSRIVLGVVAAVLLVGGIWYIASLRTENAMLREQLASAQARGEPRAQVQESLQSGTAAGSGNAESQPSRQASASRGPQRSLSDEQRTSMRYELSSEQGRTVWFSIQARDSEVAAFQVELEAVFREAGWEIGGTSNAGYRIKAGIYVFMADEEPATHVATALRGLEAGGLTVVAGTGYREYYKERAAQDPNFRGHDLGPDQDFVIVIGPSDESST